MTYKKLRILQTALQLFAKEGYHATPTSKLAKQARVSEGLIFKHFGSKKGLLEAILEEGNKRLTVIYSSIIEETDPKEALRKTLLIPYQIKATEYDFWKLQYKLKWELDLPDGKESEELFSKLVSVLAELNYPNPEMEAQQLLYFLDGLTAAILKGSVPKKKDFKEYLISRYNLSD